MNFQIAQAPQVNLNPSGFKSNFVSGLSTGVMIGDLVSKIKRPKPYEASLVESENHILQRNKNNYNSAFKIFSKSTVSENQQILKEMKLEMLPPQQNMNLEFKLGTVFDQPKNELPNRLTLGGLNNLNTL